MATLTLSAPTKGSALALPETASVGTAVVGLAVVGLAIVGTTGGRPIQMPGFAFAIPPVREGRPDTFGFGAVAPVVGLNTAEVGRAEVGVAQVGSS